MGTRAAPITEAMIQESFTRHEQGVGVQAVARQFHIGHDRLREAMKQADPIRFARLKQQIFQRAGAKVGAFQRQKAQARHERRVFVFVDPTRTVPVPQTPAKHVRSMEAFSPEELKALKAKVEHWITTGAGRAVPVYLTTLPGGC